MMAPRPPTVLVVVDAVDQGGSLALRQLEVGMRRIRLVAALLAVAMALVGCATATLLPDGRVLLLSGIAKFYDPATGQIALGPSPTTPVYFNTTTLLDDGKVLIAGGQGESSPLPTATLFDPATGLYTETGSMADARSLHTATLLQDGKVLVTGGGALSMGDNPLGGLTGESPAPTQPPLATAELYDPATGTWSPTGSLKAGLIYHSANLLQDGKVLVVGVSAEPATAGGPSPVPVMVAQLYDPASGTFSDTATPSIRALHTATTLADGRVLLAGGVSNPTEGTSGEATPLGSAEIYDPASGSWSAAGEMGAGRIYHAAALLQDGKVLIAGGVDATQASSSGGSTSAELFDPATGTWSPTGDLTSPRLAATAATLQDGKVLVAGIGDMSQMGQSGSSESPDLLNAADIYDPATGTFTAVEVETAPMPSPSA
jgi:hypothetical protein